MMTALYKGNISVAPSPIHGHGVFADQDFNLNDIIEECPLILVPNSDRTLTRVWPFTLPAKADLAGSPTSHT